MGSFYSVCSVSGMSLTHQPTYQQLLVPSWSNYTDSFKKKGLYCSNEGSQIFFSPFGFPIKGNYYDYGRIENIVRDDNVKMLEDFFNLQIEQILDCALDDRWITYKDDKHFKINGDPKNVEILERLTFTHIRAEIYDFLSANFRNEYLDWKNEYLEKVMNYFKSNYLNDKKEDKWGFVNLSNIKDKLYISRLCKDNMFTLLPIDLRYTSDVEKQFKFITNLTLMYKNLMPSNYGSQTDNFVPLISLNNFSNELMKKDYQSFRDENMEYEEEN